MYRFPRVARRYGIWSPILFRCDMDATVELHTYAEFEARFPDLWTHQRLMAEFRAGKLSVNEARAILDLSPLPEKESNQSTQTWPQPSIVSR